MEKALDPNLRSAASGYMTEASRRAQALAVGANDWGRQQFGVDVVGKVSQTITGHVGHGEYEALDSHPHDESGGFYNDPEEDFFKDVTPHHTPAPASASSTKLAAHSPSIKKLDDDDDEWKDF